jgi:CheY-like chemotaxis protein
MARILIIDDTVEITRVYSTVLTGKGHSVVVAASELQAWSALEDGSYDYVLLDILMPDYSGLDLLERSRLHERCPDTRIIILSNSESDELVQKAKQLGADRYLIKVENDPYRIAELIEKKEL